jgi:hypothetical protein
LSVAQTSFSLKKGWTSVTDQISAVGGSVTWTAGAGVHLTVSPSSGSLGAGGKTTLVIEHRDNSAKGSSTVTVTGERGSVSITVTWTK